MIARREFITLLGGAAATWPLAARAQQAGVPLIGVLFNGIRLSDDIWQAFRQGLHEIGFVEGQNVAIKFRFAESDAEVQRLASELVRERVALIVAAPNSRAGAAAKDATTSIPIVFMNGPDPVRTGLVASLNRPGGNLTGVTLLSADLTVKRLGFLRDLLPKAALVAVLLSRSRQRDPEFQLQATQAAANSVGVRIFPVYAEEESEFEVAFADAAREGAQAVLITTSIFFVERREHLAAVAAKYKLPTIEQNREYVLAGGLMSYGPTLTDAYRQVGIYTGRILKGEKPGDLPVLQPTKFELVINLKTAKALGLAVPESLLARADEVIE
jgi:putative ABC transport system substrate-binding protein